MPGEATNHTFQVNNSELVSQMLPIYITDEQVRTSELHTNCQNDEQFKEYGTDVQFI